MTCLACGSSNLVEGVVMDSNGAPVHFQLTESPKWKQILGVGQRKVVTYACVHCGLAQQRIAFSSGDREKLARFDGPQPSVVDRDP
jgi:hypothetical protein